VSCYGGSERSGGWSCLLSQVCPPAEPIVAVGLHVWGVGRNGGKSGMAFSCFN
jgi:hypothetical protein